MATLLQLTMMVTDQASGECGANRMKHLGLVYDHELADLLLGAYKSSTYHIVAVTSTATPTCTDVMMLSIIPLSVSSGAVLLLVVNSTAACMLLVRSVLSSRIRSEIGMSLDNQAKSCERQHPSSALVYSNC